MKYGPSPSSLWTLSSALEEIERQKFEILQLKKNITQLEEVKKTTEQDIRRKAFQQVIDLAHSVYTGLIVDSNLCPCGNGRVPTQAFRTTIDTYVAQIRTIPI